MRFPRVFWSVGLGIALPVLFALAADTGRELSNPIGLKSISDIIGRLIGFAQIIMVPLSALAIMVAAFMYTTSGGSPERIKTAHRALTWGVIGLAIVVGAQFIRDVVIGVGGEASRRSFETFIKNVVFAAGSILMGISVVMILYAAFLFMTSAADPEKRTRGRNVLVYALIGVALALVSFSIPRLIENLITKDQPIRFDDRNRESGEDNSGSPSRAADFPDNGGTFPDSRFPARSEPGETFPESPQPANEEDRYPQ